MFIISIILVALPLKRHRGFKFQAPITPQMFFVPENIPNCLQKGNNFRKKPFLLLLSRLLLAREMMLKVRKWQSRPEEGIRSLPWVRGGVDLLGICGRGAGGNRIVEVSANFHPDSFILNDEIVHIWTISSFRMYAYIN